MAYLIDGSNFLGYISPELLRSKRSKSFLISKLLIFQQVKKTKITLVFDGIPDPDLIDTKLRTKAFSVLFPYMDENADLVIKRTIEKQTDLRKFYVVSSDGEIRRFAKVKGAKSLTCEEFSKQLKSALKVHKKAMEVKKENNSLSPLEVDHWLHIFGNEK